MIVYTQLVYALPPNTKTKLQMFVLQVNERRIKEMECEHVVPLIAHSRHTVHLVISRNPLAEALFNDDDDVSSVVESASMILDGRMV